MIVLLRSLLCSMVLAGTVAQSSLGETVVIPAQFDATLIAGSAAQELANGAGEFLFVGVDTGSAIARSVMRFAVDGAVPAGSRITSAQLRLTVALGVGNAALFPLAASWNEGPTAPAGKLIAEDARRGDVTWRHRFFSLDEEERTPWEEPGGDLAAQNALAVAQSGPNGTYVFGGQSFMLEVQRVAARPDLNFGWILLGNEGAANSLVCFVSREGQDPDLRPVLVIEYEPLSSLERLTLSFDQLETIGGAGVELERQDYWKPRMEGKTALEAELSRPNASAADRRGSVFVADTYAHAIRRIDPDGSIHTVAGMNDAGFDGDGPALERLLDQPMGIFLLKDGTVYITDQGNGRVRKIDAEGMLTTVATAPDGIVGGRGLWVSKDESELVYGDGRVIRRWRRDQPDAIETFASGFRNVGHLDVDDSGGEIRMLAVDMEREQVYLVSADGSKRVVAGGDRFGLDLPAVDTRLSEPRAARWLGDGSYVIGTKGGGRIWHVGSDAIARILLEGTGAGNVRNGDGATLAELYASKTAIMSQCYDVRLTPDGSLLLTTNDSGFIRVLRKHPTPAILAIQPAASGGVRLTWPARPAVTYVIETSPDLQSWVRSFSVTATGQTVSYTDVSEDLLRHYRVRVYP
ncbi:MAG TPA: DNRLRE domain-containing protein [Verrucomicrobiales bacterium]|nr:DNRLRE domain-containing protein [Verrucomicrobiales bacterium]